MKQRLFQVTCLFIILGNLLLFPIILSSSTQMGFEENLVSLNQTTGSSAILDYSPILRVGTVKSDPTSYFDEFAYLSAIPLFVFTNSSGTQFRGPLVLDSGSVSTEYFYQDWRSYADVSPHPLQYLGIGNFTDTERARTETTMHTVMQPSFPLVDPYRLSSLLARYDWVNSSEIIMSPAFTDLPEHPVTTLSDSLIFQSAEVRDVTLQGTIAPNTWENHTLLLPASDGYVNGSLAWTPQFEGEALTHLVLDPTSKIKDYSTYIYSYIQSGIYSLGVESRFPVGNPGEWHFSIFGKDISGSRDYSVELEIFPALRKSLVIPSNVNNLNVSIEWPVVPEEVNLFLINPEGEQIAISVSDNSASANPSEAISIHNPVPGNWTIMAVWLNPDNGNMQIDFDIEYQIIPSYYSDILFSAANGASLASQKNVPLIFINPYELQDFTMETMNSLNVTDIILIDIGNHVESSIISELNTTYSIEYLSLINDVITEFQSIGDLSTLVISQPLLNHNEVLPTAAYSAAMKNGAILPLSFNSSNMVDATWSPYQYPLPTATSGTAVEGLQEDLNTDDRLPHRYDMWKLANLTENWFLSLGIDLLDLVDIRFITPVTRLKTTIDRALLGEYITSRIPQDDPSDACASILRGAFYVPLITTAPHKLTSMLSLEAYSSGISFTDNNYQSHEVNEQVFLSDLLINNGHSLSTHTGDIATITQANQGLAFWSISTHGAILNSYPTRYSSPDWVGLLFSREDHTFGYEKGGSPTNPDSNGDGIVNPLDQSDWAPHPESWMDNELDNIGSTVMTIVGCLVGSSRFPEVFLDHGASSVIASTRSIYFHSGGWSNSRFTQLLLDNFTTGQALQQVINETSEMYSEEFFTDASAWDLSLILFGDPDVSFSQNGLLPPIALPLEKSQGEYHHPNRTSQLLATISVNRSIVNYLEVNNISFSEYSVSEVVDSIFEIYFYQSIILGPSTATSEHFTDLKPILDDYSRNGGKAFIFGLNSSWLEYNLSIHNFLESETSSPGMVYHPLVNNPLVLTTIPDTDWWINDQNDDWNVLFEVNNSATWICKVMGSGKLSLMTANINGNDTQILQNMLTWLQRGFLRGNTTEIPVIFPFQSILLIRIQILDHQYYPITNATVVLSSGNESITLEAEGEGWFSVDLPNNYTQLGVNQVHIFASSDTLDPFSISISINLYYDIIPDFLKPWIIPLLILAVTILIIRKYRKPRSKPGNIKTKQKRKSNEKNTLHIPLPKDKTTKHSRSTLIQKDSSRRDISNIFVSEDLESDLPLIQPSIMTGTQDKTNILEGKCSFCGNSLPSSSIRCPKCGMPNNA